MKELIKKLESEIIYEISDEHLFKIEDIEQLIDEYKYLVHRLERIEKLVQESLKDTEGITDFD